MKLKFQPQLQSNECALACVQMLVQHHYGVTPTRADVATLCELRPDGVSVGKLVSACGSLGLEALAKKIGVAELLRETQFPMVLHTRDRHYVVVISASAKSILVADPAYGKYRIEPRELEMLWCNEQDSGCRQGIVIVVGRGKQYLGNEIKAAAESTVKPEKILWLYWKPYRRALPALFLFLLLSGGLTLALTALSKAIFSKLALVDFFQNSSGLYGGLLLCIIGITFTDGIRRLMMHSVSALSGIITGSGYIRHTLTMPLASWHGRTAGDYINRLSELRRVQDAISIGLPGILYSFVMVVILLSYLGSLYRPAALVAAVVIGTALAYTGSMQQRRRGLKVVSMRGEADRQAQLIGMYRGLENVKVHGLENVFRKRWLRKQSEIDSIEAKTIWIENVQNCAVRVLVALKDISILFISAAAVSANQLTVAELLTIQFVSAQLSAPTDGLVGAIRSYHDAKLSIDRVRQFNASPREKRHPRTPKCDVAPEIAFQCVSFSYGRGARLVLKDFSAHFPAGRITAVVGHSGVGKSTLLKLLLQLYQPTKGRIEINGRDLAAIDSQKWRRGCSTIMQDGEIFHDTVEANIALPGSIPDPERLAAAVQVAQLSEFVAALPLQYKTRLGAEELPLSAGQRQRLLWARALYLGNRLVLFDEPTSALDLETEAKIWQGARPLLRNCTVVIVSHRSETIAKADHIVTMEPPVPPNLN